MSQVIDLGYRPRQWQREVHARLKRFSVLVVHRRGGKTVLAIMALIDAAIRTNKTRARFGYVAPLLKQAKAVAWDYLKHYASKVPGCTINEGELWVQFPNGARIRIFGADNPDSMRGLYFDGAVLDEVADFKPEVWGEVLRPALSDRQGWALFIGTPKGVNLFSELYFQAQRDPEWYAATYDVEQTKAIDINELARLKSEMTENQYRQEFLCDFSASVDNQLITIDRVNAAIGKHVRREDYEQSAIILGVDVARYGGDRSVIFRRQGLAAFAPLVFQDIDNMDLAGRVAHQIETWTPDALFIDAGRGEGVIDRLRQLGFNPLGVDFGGRPGNPKYENRRAEMWDGMSDWLKEGGALPDGDYVAMLKADMCAPTYSYANARGKFSLESKDDLRKRGLRSPDIADALALTFASPVAPRGFRRRLEMCALEPDDGGAQFCRLE